MIPERLCKICNMPLASYNRGSVCWHHGSRRPSYKECSYQDQQTAKLRREYIQAPGSRKVAQKKVVPEGKCSNCNRSGLKVLKSRFGPLCSFCHGSVGRFNDDAAEANLQRARNAIKWSRR